MNLREFAPDLGLEYAKPDFGIMEWIRSCPNIEPWELGLSIFPPESRNTLYGPEPWFLNGFLSGLERDCSSDTIVLFVTHSAMAWVVHGR